MSISSHEPDALRAQRRQKIRAEIVRYLLITLGCVLLGAGIALFLDPNSIAPGGISGVAIILNKFIPLNTGLLIFLLNIPLLLIGLIKFGKQFLFNTVYATIMLSLATDLISFVMERTNMTAVSALTGETLIAATGDLFLAAVAGGVLCAVGLGLVFRCNCTTGGLDIVVMLIHKKWRHLGVGTIFLIVDFVIAGVSAIVFESIEIGLYAAVGIAIYSVRDHQEPHPHRAGDRRDGLRRRGRIHGREEEGADGRREKAPLPHAARHHTRGGPRRLYDRHLRKRGVRAGLPQPSGGLVTTPFRARTPPYPAFRAPPVFPDFSLLYAMKSGCREAAALLIQKNGYFSIFPRFFREKCHTSRKNCKKACHSFDRKMKFVI